ncbi:glycosyltransferase family 4 protein [Nitrosopumilus sp.]|uniref:glycosyltransferase family 4 protein n=1 Tax=Nitrosopumilus sp. TaxID=2024843 RepID=UPI003D0F2154
MKVLIASGAGGGSAEKSIGKFFHLKEFGEALKKQGVEYKLVKETDYVSGFPNKNPKSWISKKKFKKLIDEFNPDLVFVDRQSHFGLETIKMKIPLFVYLRGHFWSEQEWAKKTIYKDPIMKTVINLRKNIAERVFRECQGIFMTADYLDGVIKEHIPNAKTFHFLEGLDTSRWYKTKGMKEIKHPCVGMCHDANWWGKTKEMLTLDKVIAKLPDVHFYWAGDGQYKREILEKLQKYENFHYLGTIDYPDKVRDYLSEIDIYALPTGMDTTPLSCREAMSMEKPIIASKVGGIPEMIYNDETGLLAEEGNAEQWIEKIIKILDNKEFAEQLGKNARKLVIDKFNWDKLAKNFIQIVSKEMKMIE